MAFLAQDNCAGNCGKCREEWVKDLQLQLPDLKFGRNVRLFSGDHSSRSWLSNCQVSGIVHPSLFEALGWQIGVSGLQFACATCQGLVINGTALYAILDEARLAKSFHPTRQNWEGLWMGVKLQGTRQKDMRPTGPQDSIGISQALDLDPLCSLKVLAFPCGIWGIVFFLQLAMQRLIQTPAPPRKRK